MSRATDLLFGMVIGILAALILAGVARASDVAVIFGCGNGGAGTNIFVGKKGGGGECVSPQGSHNLYVFTRENQSAAGTHDRHAAFDTVQDFYAGDVIDIAAICDGSCRWGGRVDVLAGLAPRTVYYVWMESLYGTATIVCLSPCRYRSFWLPLENGQLTLTRANFNLGR